MSSLKINLNNTNLLYLLLIGAFGPYLIPSIGIRLDHLFIYGIFGILALHNRIYLSKNPSILFMFTLLLILFLSPFFNSINPLNVISNTLFISQIENYLQPIIIFLIFSSLCPKNIFELDDVFQSGLKLVLWLVALNTIFSIYILFNPETSLVRIFSGSKVIGDFGGFSGVTNAELNLTTGKFAGIFSQTYIVGFIYSFALLGWAYIYKNNNSQNIKKFLLVLLIGIGGVMSFSKIFLIIGMPLFMIFIGFKRTIYLSMPIITIFIIMISINSTIIEIIRDYEAMKYIYRLIFGFSNDFLNIFTSGRFADGSLIIPGIIKVLSANTFFGLGYGSIETSDFSFFEIISLGGLVNLIAYSCLLIFLTMPIFFLESLKDKYFYSFFIFLSFISSIAAPILTANRISIVIWFVIIFFFHKSLKLQKA
tara:strand:+ start:18102 stop:19370 length:1269 start_codon:yes stop_codon:yes gene_type:complete